MRISILWSSCADSCVYMQNFPRLFRFIFRKISLSPLIFFSSIFKGTSCFSREKNGPEASLAVHIHTRPLYIMYTRRLNPGRTFRPIRYTVFLSFNFAKYFVWGKNDMTRRRSVFGTHRARTDLRIHIYAYVLVIAICNTYICTGYVF